MAQAAIPSSASSAVNTNAVNTNGASTNGASTNGAGATGPKVRPGRTEQGRRQVRTALALAALELFAARGFEATTVDEIAERAGVGRRTFFRYFRSKEDVVFPDHEERLAEVVRLLENAEASEPALEVVGRTAEIVLAGYLAEPEVSLRRFALTRQVPSLRDKEIASIDRYQRTFARYLQERFADEPGGGLRASVAAAAIVAAHNHVLRDWLKSGGTLDARAALHRALSSVRDAMSVPWGGEVDAARTSPRTR